MIKRHDQRQQISLPKTRKNLAPPYIIDTPTQLAHGCGDPRLYILLELFAELGQAAA